ncbi:hypothetical protein [Jannaschia rubra]|uniref:SnoaL-like domain protein n=1 Tax=Jannaschia rubra TaxID=282197 RepID=A0A0M6XTU2_9RHOB|nr:hypothetical protein [Jannaschia rubra]CTQ33384.1 hypothetical protein JAN5088_02166 [Jannaschia rubra]SFG00504.1 hypothetical protein SAMN04488517_102212 [Jannaschia rubra]
MAADPGETLLDMLKAWNEADSGVRDDILTGATGPSFTYRDPHAPGPIAGAEGMADYLTIFRQNLPDAVLVPGGRPKVTHDTAMVYARLDRDGEPFARLIFVGTAKDGKLTDLSAFMESE